MDVQRSRKKGRANCYVVVQISSAEIRKELRAIQLHLESAYPTSRSELRQGFTNLESDVHLTLFALHANSTRIQQVLRAVEKFVVSRKDDMRFKLELRGLGSWITAAGNIILFADLSKDSASSVRALAKNLRDFLLNAIRAEENIGMISAPSPEKTVAKEKLNSLARRKEEDALPANATRTRTLEMKKEEDKESDEDDNYEDLLANPNRNRYRMLERENDEDEESDENNHTEAEKKEEGEGDEEDFEGLWFDDPRPDVYIPHVTILNSDPKWDKKFRMQLAQKKDARGVKGSKAMKQARKHQQQNSAESFGADYALFRDLRTTYSKFSFGSQRIEHIELQSEFVCLRKIPLFLTE